MADEDENLDAEGDDAEDSEQKGSSKKNLIILIVLALVLIGVSVGGTIAALKFLAPPAAVDGEEMAEEELQPAKKPAIYYPLKPALIVTYQVRGRHRYAQIGITLMFRDEDVVAAIELHKPMILNALNMIIAGQLYEDIQTAEGKELLRLQCLEELQRLLEIEIGKPGIEQVLFTDFVMQ